jgi:hypothetical protein
MLIHHDLLLNGDHQMRLAQSAGGGNDGLENAETRQRPRRIE